jgi:hypothetical protein
MILTKNIPSAGGFSCGLLFGVRYGWNPSPSPPSKKKTL